MNYSERLENDNDIVLLGAQLRELREAQGLSYDDIANKTHMRPHILKSIEDGNLGDIAAPVYVRGFVKSYCEYLMAHDLWKKYSLILPTSESPKARSATSAFAPVDISHPRPVFKRTSIIWVYIVLVVAVLGAGFLLWNQHKNPDSAQNGFFLKFTSRNDGEPAAEQPLPSQESEGPSLAEPQPEQPVSDEPQGVFAASIDQSIAANSEPQSVDLSWMDGGEAAQSGQNITVPLSQIPDNRLLIEVTAPVRLIVQQDGAVVTRRNLTAGGVRSYDVTGATPVSLSVGRAAELTWNGKKYSPLGGDNKPLALTFYPDGSVSLTEGTSPHFRPGMNSPD